MQRSNPAGSQRVLTPEDIRVHRARADTKVKLATVVGCVEAIAPGALNALVGHGCPKRELDIKSTETQAALKAVADAKRARKAARLAKGLKPA